MQEQPISWGTFYVKTEREKNNFISFKATMVGATITIKHVIFQLKYISAFFLRRQSVAVILQKFLTPSLFVLFTKLHSSVLLFLLFVVWIAPCDRTKSLISLLFCYFYLFLLSFLGYFKLVVVNL